jgi:gamma-glutamyl:cysteine ligase YbdK (ATP-grasp superfamily)
MTLPVPTQPLRLFQAYGVELEYMIVDRQSLDVLPVADQLLRDPDGQFVSEVEHGEIAWSNELVLHLVEFKTNGPAGGLDHLPTLFQDHVRQVNSLLATCHAQLMPTAMHPWMHPDGEMKLWPHDYNTVYETYHRIFDCRGHGWANLQSVHLNLPFGSDDEFARLHAAIRLVLPIMPALAASSPLKEGHLTGLQDTRLDVYRTNARRIPSITGEVVPEAVFCRADYEREVLRRMYDDIAPLDPEQVLQYEWLNSRGAIARFDRNAIEIRVLDIQECPLADIAVCQAVTAVLQALAASRWTASEEQQALATPPLARILVQTTRDAEQTVIDDARYLAQFGFSESRCSAQELWQHLVECTLPSASRPAHAADWQQALQVILREGPLSRRIVAALGSDPAGQLLPVYRELCDCLAQGRMFQP